MPIRRGAGAPPLGAVQLYEEVIIEPPANELAAARPYTGPERRSGAERRHATA